MSKEIDRRLHNIKTIENGKEENYHYSYFEAKDVTIEDFKKEHPCAKIEVVEFYYGIGSSILEDYEDMCVIAKQYPDILFCFEGNGVMLYADAKSDPKLAETYFTDCINLDVHELGPRELSLSDRYISLKEYERSLKDKICVIEKDLQYAKEKLHRFQNSFYRNCVNC